MTENRFLNLSLVSDIVLAFALLIIFAVLVPAVPVWLANGFMMDDLSGLYTVVVFLIAAPSLVVLVASFYLKKLWSKIVTSLFLVGNTIIIYGSLINGGWLSAWQESINAPVYGVPVADGFINNPFLAQLLLVGTLIFGLISPLLLLILVKNWRSST